MSAPMTINELASIVGGRVISGDPALSVHRVMPIEAAADDAITFVTKPKYLAHLESTRAVALLADPAMLSQDGVVVPERLAVIGVEHPYVAFAKVAQALADEVPRPLGVHPSAAIDPGATIGADVAIGPFVYVGPGACIGEGAVLYPGVHVCDGARVGAGSVLYNHVVIRHGCRVGERCILHAGVVIGSDGFGFAQELAGSDLRHVKIPQVGHVVIEDDVEIGANSCVDRGTLGATRVGAQTKIDNLVQVGHNVQIGAKSILVAQSGVAGSSKLGEATILGAQSGISGHIELGANVMVYGQSGVMQNLEAGDKVCGTPAVPVKEFFRNVVRVGKLEALVARVKKLERALEKLGRQ